MKTAQDFYKQLISAEATTHHLVLAGLFEVIFNRRVQRNEWGLLRKLIRIYGSEMVYWAMLSSAQATGPTPLAYVMGVCKGMMKEAVVSEITVIMDADTQKRLRELRRIREELNG